MTRRIMIDLETLSDTPDAMIVAIGAVASGLYPNYSYTREHCEPDLGREFYRNIDILHATGNISKREIKRLYACVPEDKIVLRTQEYAETEAMSNFTMWVEAWCPEEIWFNPDSFSFLVLGNAFSRCKIKWLTPLKPEFCYRTLLQVLNIPEPEFEGNKLDSLHKVLNQMKVVTDALGE